MGGFRAFQPFFSRWRLGVEIPAHIPRRQSQGAQAGNGDVGERVRVCSMQRWTGVCLGVRNSSLWESEAISCMITGDMGHLIFHEICHP
jgi:hypothetical protein